MREIIFWWPQLCFKTKNIYVVSITILWLGRFAPLPSFSPYNTGKINNFVAINRCWWSQNIYSILINNFLWHPADYLNSEEIYLRTGEKKVRRSYERKENIWPCVCRRNKKGVTFTVKQLIMIKGLQGPDMYNCVQMSIKGMSFTSIGTCIKNLPNRNQVSESLSTIINFN